jgi:hypothetical protein
MIVMFNWIFKKNSKKIVRENTFVCKHCKYTCEGCNTRFCYACYSNMGNPCPKCGNTNLNAKILTKKDT